MNDAEVVSRSDGFTRLESVFDGFLYGQRAAHTKDFVERPAVMRLDDRERVSRAEPPDVQDARDVFALNLCRSPRSAEKSGPRRPVDVPRPWSAVLQRGALTRAPCATASASATGPSCFTTRMSRYLPPSSVSPRESWSRRRG